MKKKKWLFHIHIVIKLNYLQSNERDGCTYFCWVDYYFASGRNLKHCNLDIAVFDIGQWKNRIIS